MNKLIGPNLLAGIVASVVFIISYIVIDWPLLISLVLAVGIFFAVYFLSKPILKIGDLELSQMADGVELNNIYQEARRQVHKIEENGQKINNEDVGQGALQLASTSQDILRYLEDNPREISQSRHFLTYYVPTANKIIDNYFQLKKANISADKFELITDQTLESIELLQKIFVNQRDGYHKDKLVELEVQTELLEKTITLGGEEL